MRSKKHPKAGSDRLGAACETDTRLENCSGPGCNCHRCRWRTRHADVRRREVVADLLNVAELGERIPPPAVFAVGGAL